MVSITIALLFFHSLLGSMTWGCQNVLNVSCWLSMRTVNHTRMPKPLLDLYADCELPRKTLVIWSPLTNSYSPTRKLHVILHGSSPNNESSWKVKYIRQRVQRQYKWKPEKRLSKLQIVCVSLLCCVIALSLSSSDGFWPVTMLISLIMKQLVLLSTLPHRMKEWTYWSLTTQEKKSRFVVPVL